MDGCSTSWYSERNSDRKSSSGGSTGGGEGGDDAAADWYAERVSFAGQDLKTSSAICGGLVDRVPERVNCMWPRAWAGTCGLLRRTISGVRFG
jgi:hypothetical protein